MLHYVARYDEWELQAIYVRITHFKSSISIRAAFYSAINHRRELKRKGVLQSPLPFMARLANARLIQCVASGKKKNFPP